MSKPAGAIDLKHAVMVAVLAGVLLLFPFLFASPGADVFFHYTMIDCFGEQFWHGDFFPRWYVDANNGLGSPAPLFYFPLPYYITSLFYPLHWAGLSIEHLYYVSLGFANIVTVITCFLWLKEIVSPGRALLCAVLFILFPYRMELMLYRSAFSEIWCMALLPLAFLYTRRIIQEKPGSAVRLSLALVFCLLAHTTVTFIAVLACSVYVMLLSGKSLRIKGRFVSSVIISGMAVAFYILPAHFFWQFIHPEAVVRMHRAWTNNFVTAESFATHANILINCAITILLIIALAVMCFSKRGLLPDFIRHEALVWVVIAACGAFLMFSISNPLWEVIRLVMTAITPWRAQLFFVFAAIYLIAIRMQWQLSVKQLKSWKGDYAAIMVMFILLGLFVFAMRPAADDAFLSNIVRARIIATGDYRSEWSDKATAEFDAIGHMDASSSSKARIVQGSGSVSFASSDYQGFKLTTDLKSDGVILFKQFYFPIWQLMVDGKISNGLMPAKPTGFMELHIPAGKHELFIKRDLATAMGPAYYAGWIISLITWFGMALSLRRKPR